MSTSINTISVIFQEKANYLVFLLKFGLREEFSEHKLISWWRVLQTFCRLECVALVTPGTNSSQTFSCNNHQWPLFVSFLSKALWVRARSLLEKHRNSHILKQQQKYLLHGLYLQLCSNLVCRCSWRTRHNLSNYESR